MFESFRRYDTQAAYALWLSLTSALVLLLAGYAAVRNYHSDLNRIVYGELGNFRIVFGCSLLLALLLGGTGAALGLSSAGQRRNSRQRWSWLGFFIGGTVVTCGVIMIVMFLKLGMMIPATS